MYIYMHVLLAGWFFTMRWKKQILVLHVITKLVIMNIHLIIDPNLKPLQMTCLEEDVH